MGCIPLQPLATPMVLFQAFRPTAYIKSHRQNK